MTPKIVLPRRNFLKASSAAALAVGVRPWTSVLAQSASQRKRVA
jgi:hypothetical protein